MRSRISFFAAFALMACFASAQNSPFTPPRASLHYAPDRTCDLQHIDVTIDIDYPNRVFTGTSINTLAALRTGISEITLHAGANLDVKAISIDGRSVTFKRDGKQLIIATGPLAKGKPFKVKIDYSAKNSKGGGFGSGGGGFHWINPTTANPTRIGFWTQGESEYNSEWAPTWDYPNDLATSETKCTVQADWDVIGNGVLTSTTLSADKTRKTYQWKMSQPHATYLLALYGGPFDIKKDKWEGVDLWYVVPRNSGYLIDNSFANTKDMLSFYSKVLGVKYAWPKYAQVAAYDFGGGMENVSATILGEGSLTEARDGYFEMDSLNSHELAHQWFGDLVTCKDWGDAWLNESFATFMQILYFEHSRGEIGYDKEIEGAMRAYFGEARRYKRPISTKMYPNADAMFDSHTYPKGGAVLHTLRKQIGDEAFFSGLNYYLTKWRHTPVESAQLRRAFIEATGINVEPFWAQWFDKPGHPVIEYTWSYDDAAKEVVVSVKQTQDTTTGTPIYEIPAKIGLLSGDYKANKVEVTRSAFQLNAVEQQFRIKVGTKPTAVILDPDHDFLREMKHDFAVEELPIIAVGAPNSVDRASAFSKMLATPNDDLVQLAFGILNRDSAIEPAIEQTSNQAALTKPEFRAFWLGQLNHKNFRRQAQAVAALGRMPADAATIEKLRSLVNDKAPIQVVVNAISALSNLDAKANADVFKKALEIKDRRSRIKRAAETALAK